MSEATGYVWMKTVVSYNDGTSDLESRPICVKKIDTICKIQPIYAQGSSYTLAPSDLKTITTSSYTPADDTYIYTGLSIGADNYITGCWEGAKLRQYFNQQKKNAYNQIACGSGQITLSAKQSPHYKS